ncbi:MAG TPA: hypothetical protein VNO20_06680 [Solirubrobacterales bacterium]|nr:hypothetical protein [Solirubrobacterales bacterium]
MPSDVFWTGFFTFGGGVVGATVGYATARLQNRLQREQLLLEKRRDERQFSKDSEEQLEQRREQRRAVYLHYLEALDAIIHSATTETIDQETLSSRWIAFNLADNELELAGTEAVKESSYPLHTVIAEAIDRFSVVIDSETLTWPDDATSYMRSIEDKLRQARQGTISLMRRDLHEADNRIEAS